MQVKAKKHFGQNFLQDMAVIDRIIESAHIQSNDTVVEIGPGTGVLTRALSEKAGQVIAFELDKDLIPNLLKLFPLSSNVSIVEQDILHADVIDVLQKHTGNQKYKVVANIPYYITAPIIQYLLQLSPSPETIVLMVQKEVAERITAKAGDMSIISVAVQYYSDPELLFTVPKEAFLPVPQVDSAVIRLRPKKVFDKDEDRRFFRYVKAGFAARRKTLANNLSSVLHLPKEETIRKIQSLGFDGNIRAQALSVSDWDKAVEVFSSEN